jgi:hypothetical protein
MRRTWTWTFDLPPDQSRPVAVTARLGLISKPALPCAVSLDPLGERILERGRDADAGAACGPLEPVDQICRN